MKLRTSLALLPYLAVLPAHAQVAAGADPQQTPASAVQDNAADVATPSAPAPASAAAPPADRGDAKIEEIVVTANKRAESARTVPSSRPGGR